jgi:large subunit ribosomal protein L25
MALVSQVMHEITIECFPADIPSAIEVELSPLIEIGDAIFVRDLVVPESTTIVSEPEQVVVRAGQGRVAAEAAALDAEAAEATAAEGGVEEPEEAGESAEEGQGGD